VVRHEKNIGLFTIPCLNIFIDLIIATIYDNIMRGIEKDHRLKTLHI